MAAWRRALAGLRHLVRPTRGERDLDAELRAFVEAAVEDRMQGGTIREDAVRAVRAELGSIDAVKDQVRDAGWETSFEHFLRDVRYASRGLLRSRAFAATTVLTLAAGLSLVTMVFTVFNAYVLRPFAVREPYGLHEIRWRTQEAGGRTFRWQDYEDLRARNDLFEAVIGETDRYVTSRGTTLSAAFVTGNYFEALGAPVLIGRGLADYDASTPGAAPVAVLSDQGWSRLFDRDPGVVGQEIELNTQKVVVVGIARAEFQGLEDAPQDLWVPLTMYQPVIGQDVFGASALRRVRVVARLRPGVTAAQAENAVTLAPFESRVAGRLDFARAELQVHATRVRLTPELIAVLSPVFAAFLLVLAAACANASNVMLARANARHREIGVRLALGASRGRVVRQLLTEGLLIAAAAGVLGLVLAGIGLRAGTRVLFDVLPAALAPLVRVAPLDFDFRVFMFALAAAAGATLLFALVPALHATRLTLTDAIRGQAAGLRSSTLRNLLVGAQVAISLALLIIAATFVRNSAAIGATDLGLDPRGVLSINQRSDKTVVRRAAAALAADPGTEQVVVTSRNPLFGQLPKAPVRQGDAVFAASYVYVSPEYFSMLRIPIVHGRGFRPEEGRERSGAAIVSAAAARVLWPGEDPVGKTLRLPVEEDQTRVGDTVRSLRSLDGARAPEFMLLTVVGVAGNAVTEFVYAGKGAVQVYLPTAPDGAHAEALLVRRRPGAGVTVDALRPLLERIHPDPLMFETIPLEQMVGVQLFPLRAASWIGSFLGAIALALGVCGLYGVLSYTLGQRGKEIAVRMALGATAAAVVRLVMRQSAQLAGLGAAVGLLFAFAVMKVLSAFVRLDNVSVLDAGAFAIAVVLVASAVALASFGPARRATRVDPSLMLKGDA